MIVFHGTISKHVLRIRFDGISLDRCQPFSDFGNGFYVTTNKEQAVAWAELEAYKKNIKYAEKTMPAVLVFELDEKLFTECKGIVFDNPDIKWQMFVYNNRIGYNNTEYDDNLDKKYDYVSGCLADGIMYDIYKVKNGTMSKNDFVKTITSIGSQISLNTEKSLKYIKCIGVE